MEVFVGTSGWLYGWNEKKSLEWYVKNSSLNAVELNATFYRFPFPKAVSSWAVKGKTLRWSIKANRWLTHILRFNEKAFAFWQRFEKLFEPMDHLVDFYLFQIPPSMKVNMSSRIEAFIKKTGLEKRFAFEPRNIEWFDEKWLEWASSLGIIWVSIDCPDLPLDVFNTNGIVYERMHGREGWYTHHYSDEELRQVTNKITATRPEKVYVFFNNDHAMLDNSRKMLLMLGETAF